MTILNFFKLRFDNFTFRIKNFGVLYVLDWFGCSLARKLGIKARCFYSNQVDCRYIQRNYCQFAKQIQPDLTNTDSNNIWIMWWQGENSIKPQLVESCIDSIRRNRGDYNVVLIDKYNYQKYVNIPEVIMKKFQDGIIGIACFSDYIRFSLLEKFGGWYLDATVYVTRPIVRPNNSFYSVRYDGFNCQIPQGKWSAYLWYLPQNHPLAKFVHMVFDDYWSHHDQLINYFLIDCIVRTYYETSMVFKKQIDSLKFDNPDLFFLQSEDGESPYNKIVWEEKLNRTQFFKCNRKVPIINKDGFIATILGIS